jgi:hypothetical protein
LQNLNEIVHSIAGKELRIFIFEVIKTVHTMKFFTEFLKLKRKGLAYRRKSFGSGKQKSTLKMFPEDCLKLWATGEKERGRPDNRGKSAKGIG